MKRAIKIIVYSMIVVITAFMLFSCASESSGFNVQTNRFSKIKSSYNKKTFFADSLSYYENQVNPIIRRGDYIWYYYLSGDGSPHVLAYIDPYSCEAVTLCKDKNCTHNMASITNHCILADMYKQQLLIENEEYIYFIRTDKEVYNKSYGGAVYIEKDMLGVENVEYKYDIIRYSLGSGDYWKLHSTEAGIKINNLTLTSQNLYFVEDMILSITYPPNDEEEPIIQKTYLIMDLDKGGKSVRCLNPVEAEERVDIQSPPRYFGVIQNRIYTVVDGRFVCYDMNLTPESEFVLCDFSKDVKWYNGMMIDSVQYDQYSDNIYFCLRNENEAGGTIGKVKVYGNEYRVVRKVDLMCGNIENFQLTLEGLYFTVTGVEEMEGSIYLVSYSDINKQNAEYITAYDSELYGGMYYPTAIFGDIYAYKLDTKLYKGANISTIERTVLTLYKYNPETKEITEIKLVEPD